MNDPTPSPVEASKSSRLQKKSLQIALRISLLYWAAATLWILLSDWIVGAVVSNAGVMVRVQIYKGGAFVAITAVLLFVMLRRNLRRWDREIAARKLAEQAVRGSEKRFAGIISSAMDAIITTDEEQKITLFNSAAEKMFGYGADEIIGRPLDTLISEHYRAAHARYLQAFSQSARTRRVMGESENIFGRRASGEEFPVEASISQIKVAGKKIFSIILRDITQRKRDEQAVRENEERLRLALQAANQGLYDLNIVTGEAVVSPEYATMLGYDPGEFQETNALWRERLHPDDREPVYRIYEDYVAGNRDEYKVEFRQRMKSGEWKWVISQGKILARDRDGRPLRMLGTHTDITERKKAEQALAESEERFRLLAVAAFEGIVLSEQGKVIDANQQLAEMLGCNLKELLGKPVAQFVAPESMETVMQHIRSGSEAPYEHLARKADETVFPVEVRAKAIPYHGKNVRVTTIRDITGRKAAEEKIKASLKEKEVMLKEIHHRVKNNLQVISSLLKLQSKTIEDRRVIELFEESRQRVRSMALIHEELYKSSNLASIQFASYVRNIAKQLFRSYGASSNGIALKLDVDELLLDIDHAVPCGLIINELITNSLKHAFPKTQRDRVPNEINIQMRLKENEQVTLKVSDNGAGLPEGLDIHNTATLGMQLVNTLTAQLSGKIEYQNHHGAEFAISFSSKSPKKNASSV